MSGLSLLALSGCARGRLTRTAKTGGDAGIQGLETLLQELMARFVVPGASVAVVQDGHVAWSRAFGVRHSLSKEPVDNETLFEAASVSKTVFAYAALKQCEKGVIGLDVPLTRYTPTRFVEGDARLDQITPRLVLSHSTGFAEWRSSDGPMIRRDPGSGFEYSGEGYFYLQSVLTHLLGKVDRSQCAKYEADFEVCATDFHDFMKARVLAPFGMRGSGYVAGARWEQRIAHGHDTSGKAFTKTKPRGSDVARYGAVGGLNTTAAEYAKFLAEVVAPKSADEFRLSAGMLREMARPHIQLPKDGQIDGCNAWALGWGVQERPNGNMLVHSGGQSGFRSLALASIDRRSGFIILTNSDNGGHVIYHPDVLRLADKLVMG